MRINIKAIVFVLLGLTAAMSSAQRRSDGPSPRIGMVKRVVKPSPPRQAIRVAPRQGARTRQARPVNHRQIQQNRYRFSNRHRAVRGRFSTPYYGVRNNWGFGRYRNNIVTVVPNLLSTPYYTANQERYSNWLKEQYEVARAVKLWKYTKRPSKKNLKKLMKYNILTGRDKYDGIEKGENK